jgi:hypothetical protein
MSVINQLKEYLNIRYRKMIENELRNRKTRSQITNRIIHDLSNCYMVLDPQAWLAPCGTSISSDGTAMLMPVDWKKMLVEKREKFSKIEINGAKLIDIARGMLDTIVTNVEEGMLVRK